MSFDLSPYEKPTWNGNLCAYCGEKVFNVDKNAKCCSRCSVHQNG